MDKKNKSAIKRIVSIALLILSGYYLFVAAEIIPSQIKFGYYYPDNTLLDLIAVIIIIIALFLDDYWRKSIQNVFS